jgi:hypothetical protein
MLKFFEYTAYFIAMFALAMMLVLSIVGITPAQFISDVACLF